MSIISETICILVYLYKFTESDLLDTFKNTVKNSHDILFQENG